MIIRSIPPKSTLRIRQLVLRPGKNLQECVFDGDGATSSFHLGAFENNLLMGIVSLMDNKNSAFQETHQFQLRGMAVLPEFRNRKIAKNLLKTAEEKLVAQKMEILWCNARKNAVGFYEKYGFERLGEGFEIPEIGFHYLLFKNLEN